MNQVSGAWVMPIVIAAVAAISIAALGSTITDLGSWYHSLNQPAWAPPEAAYGIAWTTIYALTALAAVFGWEATPKRRDADWLIGLFCLNGSLNILWSFLFFHLHRPDWALAGVVALWLSILWLIIVNGRFSKTAAGMLLPYLAWVSFAGALNLAIVRLNGPFA